MAEQMTCEQNHQYVWKPSQQNNVDYEPRLESDEFFDYIINHTNVRPERSNKSWQTYILGPPEPNQWEKPDRVRVNVKWRPTSTKTGVPQHLVDYRKTVVVKLKDKDGWLFVEERKPAWHIADLEPRTVEWGIIFLQPPRWWRYRGTKYWYPVEFTATVKTEKTSQHWTSCKTRTMCIWFRSREQKDTALPRE